MTHFYIQLAMNGNTPKRDTIEKIFLGKFKQSEFSKEKNFVILAADFLDDNFYLEKKDSKISLQINTKIRLAFKGSQKEKKKEMSYSPVITIDTKTMDVEIKTDPFGADLIYIAILENGELVISSHMKYIIAMHPKLLNELDYNALVEYLFCHSVLGIKTYFKKIRLLPGNSKITIKDWEKKSQRALADGISLRKTWYNFPKNYGKLDEIDQTATEICELLKKQMKSFASIEGVDLAFLLSGGLDSRLLISAIDKKWKKPIETYTFDSFPDGKEIKYAKGVSDILSIPHHFRVVSDADVLKYCYKHMWYCEGLSNHVISIRHALYEEVNGDKLFFDGFLGDGPFGGNYLVYTEKFVRKYKSPEKRLMENLIANEYAFPKRKFYSILNASKDQTLQILEQGMKEQRNLLWSIDNESLELEYLITQTRARGYMLGGSRSFSHLAPTFVPFSHPEIISSYLKVPPKLRKKRKLEILTLECLNKELADYPTTSLIWYNRLFSTWFIQFGFKSLQFFESIFRVSLIPKYSSVPYFEWMRKRGSYYEMILDLLCDEAIIWNILDKTKTMKLFNDFIRRKNHLHKFILHIIDLEITLRLFFALKEDSEEIELVSDAFKTKKSFLLKLSLEHLELIVKE